MDPIRNLVLLDVITLTEQLQNTDYFLNPIYMIRVQTIINIILTKLDPNLWLYNIKSLGDESAIGYALLADLEIGDNIGTEMLIIKGPRLNRNSIDIPDPIAHEVEIGLSLNTLRLNKIFRVPNFVFTYASFRSLPPMIGPDGSATWCRTKPNLVLTYSLQENISPSMSLKEYCKDCTINQFLNIYIQVLFALNLAHKELDFTHYDLHCNNILVRFLEKDIDIKYDINNKIYIIQTKILGVIIDFDYSHIRGKGIDNVNAGIHADRSFPLHDAYRLLTTSLRMMKISNNNSYKDLIPILNFFYSDESIDKLENYIIDPDWREYYLLPDGETEYIPMSNFILWLINRYKINIYSNKRFKNEINNNISLPLLEKSNLSFYQAVDLRKIDINTRKIIYNRNKQLDAINKIEICFKIIKEKRKCLSPLNNSNLESKETYNYIWTYLYNHISILSILSILESYINIFRTIPSSKLYFDLEPIIEQYYHIKNKYKDIIEQGLYNINKWQSGINEIYNSDLKDKYGYLFYTYSMLI